ncbi:MAG: hypothetical protein ACO1N0_12380 [Fluviicola sp.]
MRNLSVFLCLFITFGSFSQEDVTIRPIDISFDLNKLKTLDFGTDSLNGEKLLFQFFPAPMNEDDPELSEWRTSAFWSCSSCTRREMTVFENAEESERETLPFDANYTSCTSILYYQSEKGTLRAIVSFSTSQMNDGTGRFTRGLLSLANFEKQNGTWKLLNFEPFVNFQGSFTMASPVDEVLIDQNGKTYFLIHGGEANGVSPEEYWPIYQGLYVIDGKYLSEVLHVSAASCKENNDPVGSFWDTEIKILGDGLLGLNMETKTSGLIVKQYSWGLPESLQYISESDFEALPERFNFITTQKFTRNTASLLTEKPMITIQYKDSKGTVHEQVVNTEIKRIK